MTKYNIIVTLFTIVFGLMLTDLFASLHKLLKISKKVKWHWLPLLACWYLFLLILKNWWDLAIPENDLKEYNIISFIIYGHLLIVFYLLASTALPDTIAKKGINLKDYYFQNHRYFWGLMTWVVVISIIVYLVHSYIQSSPLNLTNIIANIVLLLFTLLMVFSKKYWVHSIVLVFFVVLTVFEIVQKI